MANPYAAAATPTAPAAPVEASAHGWRSRENRLFAVLGAIMLTSAVVAELIAVKLIQVPFYKWFGFDTLFTLTCGSLMWPLVFLATDTINEFFGKRAVRFISFLTVAMIVWMFIIVNLSIGIEAASFSKVQDEPYRIIFGQSRWIMAGSILAFLVSQFIDVFVFHRIRKFFGGRFIWARATGSTIVSQLVDSYVVIYIAFGLSEQNTWAECDVISRSSFTYKVGIAVALTPLIYVAHWLVKRWLGAEHAHRLAEQAARDA